MRCCIIWLLTTALCGALPAIAEEETVDSLLKKARAALAKKETEEALTLAGKAIARDSKNAQAYIVRGQVYAALAEHTKAVADFDKAISLDHHAAEAYNSRGGERFKLGQISESIADFDKFLELRPDEKARHWMRGISYYYAGRFEDGQKQFEAYEKIDSNDVENAVWRFLCMARTVGVDKAGSSIQKIGKDERVPMMQIYALFRGEVKPEDVLTAAQAGKPTADQLHERLFYAHLYLGLYYEANGDKKRSLEHMTKAAEDHKIAGHYMWDVARVHVQLRRKEAKHTTPTRSKLLPLCPAVYLTLVNNRMFVPPSCVGLKDILTDSPV